MRGGGISTAVQASDKADSTTNRRYVGKLDSIQKINEVIIVGTPVIPKYREVIPAQVLKEVDLQRLNSLSVADAIRYFAGVQLKDYGGVGGLKTVNIRSMGTNHMAVFYDGIQLGNAQNGQVDLGRFSLDDVEEISLYNGQKSDIFQSAKDFGASGTIYITTRRVDQCHRPVQIPLPPPQHAGRDRLQHNGLPTERRHQRYAHGGRTPRQDGRRTMDRAGLHLQLRTRHPGSHRQQRLSPW